MCLKWSINQIANSLKRCFIQKCRPQEAVWDDERSLKSVF